jgi:hypothetical protein
MKRFLPALLIVLMLPAWGQSVPGPYQIADNNATPPPGTPPPAEPAPTAHAAASEDHPSVPSSKSVAIIDRLTSSNQDLLDLLKKQQAVLEDIQYDRRLQNRQITLIEERLEDTLQENAALQVKVAKLQTELADAATKPSASGSAADLAESAVPNPVPTPVPAPPAPPASYLPLPETTGQPGTMWWHRVQTISGDDSRSTDMFHIEGKQWRVIWHNQDRPGVAYKNTSALFISAFPKNDTIPKKICSQLGSGGDKLELTGSGDYYLKIEASGGHWEAAVDDFRPDSSSQ